LPGKSLVSLKIINTLFVNKPCPLFGDCAWQSDGSENIKLKINNASKALPGLRLNNVVKWLGQFR
jgi:hypothetical protein